MGRRLRRPDENGMLRCTRGDHMVHIRGFYQSGGAYISWYNPIDGVTEWYGRPNSWCIECQKKAQKESNARALEREKVIKEMSEKGIRDLSPERIERYIYTKRCDELDEANRLQALMDKPPFDTWEEANNAGAI